MKIEQTTVVDYDEVDTDFRMKLPVLFQRLQRAAVYHSERVGLGSAAMVETGAVWILNRMRVDICRMPVYREEITLRTWHKGSAGFRAGRDFQVLCGDEQVGIQFLKEIGRDVHALQAGAAAGGNTVRFRFFDPAAVYAAGFVTAR